MKAKKSINLRAAIFSVQAGDLGVSEINKSLVFRHAFPFRIAKIRQETKVHILISVREEPNFQSFHQFDYALWCCEHGWNHDQRTQLRGNPMRKIHPRQLVWWDQLG